MGKLQTANGERVPEVLAWAAKRLAWERNLEVLRAEASAVVDSATSEVSHPARTHRRRRFTTRPEPATEG